MMRTATLADLAFLRLASSVASAQVAAGAFDFALAITNRSDEKRKGTPWL